MGCRAGPDVSEKAKSLTSVGNGTRIPRTSSLRPNLSTDDAILASPQIMVAKNYKEYCREEYKPHRVILSLLQLYVVDREKAGLKLICRTGFSCFSSFSTGNFLGNVS